MIRETLATKLFHTLVLLLFAAAVLLFGAGGASDTGTIAWVASVVGAWVLGQQYERNLVLTTGLVSLDELREAEWNSTTVWDDRD